MKRTFNLALTVLSVISIAQVLDSPPRATSSKSWDLRSRADFAGFDLDGVALSSDGSLRLSAKVTTLFDPAQPYQWCLVRDKDGNIYSGGGNQGQVFRSSPPGGEPEIVFDSDELEVHSLAVDSSGRVYAATSPDGAVYRVTGEGNGAIAFDPGETYIWAIAFDAGDRLLVATGHPGRIYRVDSPGPGATGAVLLDGPEEHIRTLAPGSDGAFYAGSDENGIIYRISASGEATVVYDSPMREIASIAVAVDPSGTERIYAAALSPLRGGQADSGAQTAEGVSRVRVTADDPEDSSGDPENDQQPEQRQQRPPRQAENYYGAIYRITPGGYGRKVWESREVLPLTLLPFGDDGVLVGTGNDGRVLLLGESGEVTDFVTVPASQVNHLIAGDPRRIYAAASNLGLVVQINPAGTQEGTVTSMALDAGYTSTWGAMSWSAETPPGTSVAMMVRTGDTEEPDASWSAWSGGFSNPAGSTIDRPKARYVQWRATLRSQRRGESPVLRGVRVGYLQDNMPPLVTELQVQAPGVVLSAGGERAGNAVEGSPAEERAKNKPRQSFRHGGRSVSWSSEDANDDALRYDVFFKAEDETLWKPLAQEITNEYHSWDETTMPDGVYRIRVTASDAPTNPAGSGMTASRTSEPFSVDITPPRVSQPRARFNSRTAEVTVSVEDTFSPIGEAAYSIDAGEWMALLPEDLVADTLMESFRFETPELEPGEHTVTIRASDTAGNTSANKIVIRVEN